MTMRIVQCCPNGSKGKRSWIGKYYEKNDKTTIKFAVKDI